MNGIDPFTPQYPNRLIDNADPSVSLCEVLRSCLNDERFDTLHIATGYWDLPGMTLLIAELEGFLRREGTRIELLIGKDPYVYASMVQKPQYKTADYPADFIRTDLSALAVTEQHVRALALLLTHCPGERINVHLYCGTDADGHEQFLHSKCYIFTGSTYSCGIVGSSNFTGKGLLGNAELNYLEGSSAIVTALSGHGSTFDGHLAWFRRKWADSAPWSQTFLEQVVRPTPGCRRAEQATAPLTPHELYIKALIDKFGDILDEQFSHTLSSYLPADFSALDYQLDAVKQCWHILHEHGGFLLSDVVGLGKTVVALLLVKHFLTQTPAEGPRPRRVLIVAPPAVLGAWRDTIDHFDATATHPIAPHIHLTTPGHIRRLLGDDLPDPLSDEAIAPDTSDDPDTLDAATLFDIPNSENDICNNAVDNPDDNLDDITDDNNAAGKTSPLTAAQFDASHPEADFGLVIIDESHRLRHQETRAYRQLDELISNISARHGLCPYVGLLSATPQNNKPTDLQNQLYLFFRNRTATTLTKADGGNLKTYFRRINLEYHSIIRRRYPRPTDPDFGKPLSPEEAEQLNARLASLSADLRDHVLQDLLVRRTRTDVQRYYHADLHFPEVVGPESLHYRLSPSLSRLFAHTVRLIGPRICSFFKTEDSSGPQFIASDFHSLGGLTYSRYRALEFLTTPAHIQRYAWRNMTTDRISRQLALLSQINLIKRFESSFTAFKISLRHLRQKTQVMIDMWEHDAIFVCPAFDVNALFDLSERYKQTGIRLTFDDVAAEIRQKIAALPPEKNAKGQNAEYHRDDFHPLYIEALHSDLEFLNALIDDWNNYSDDPKLDAFKRALVPVLLDPARNPSGLLVIFTESADTLHAVAHAIESVDPDLPVLTVTSANRRDVEPQLRANFDANYRGTPRSDFRILVTTDVLAEGINLHRANTILNYDTPWNATRLMQRIGRVNRIGSTADRVYVYNFMPSVEGDSIIRLVHKAHTKLQTFHHLFGEDSRIFTSAEEVVHHELHPDTGSVSSELERYLYELKHYKDAHPARYAHLLSHPYPIALGVQLPQTQGAAPIAPDPQEPTEGEVPELAPGSTLCLLHTPDGHSHYTLVGPDLSAQTLPAAHFFEALRRAVDAVDAPVSPQLSARHEAAVLAVNQALSTFDPEAAKSHDATLAKELLRELWQQHATDATFKRLLTQVRSLIDKGNTDVIRRCLRIRHDLKAHPSLFTLTHDEILNYLRLGFSAFVQHAARRHGKPSPDLTLTC